MNVYTLSENEHGSDQNIMEASGLMNLREALEALGMTANKVEAIVAEVERAHG